MNDGTEDEVSVSFPASPVFAKVGRVAVAGLALRLGVDISEVERLRLAVDEAVDALNGRGRITLSLRWEPHQLTVTVDNPDHDLDATASQTVTASLSSKVDAVTVGPNGIDLTLVGANGNSAP